MKVFVDLDKYIVEYRETKGTKDIIKESKLYNNLLNTIKGYSEEKGYPIKIHEDDMGVAIDMPIKEVTGKGLGDFFEKVNNTLYDFISKE